MSFHGPWPVASSLWRNQSGEYFCEHICTSQEIIKTRRVGTKDVWGEETKSFIIEEDDLGGSAKSLFIWMVIMIMILSINNVGERKRFLLVCFLSPSSIALYFPLPLWQTCQTHPYTVLIRVHLYLWIIQASTFYSVELVH